MRWLGREIPDLEQARHCADRIVKDLDRSAEIISRTRQLFKKGSVQRQLVDANELIDEIIALLRNVAARSGVFIRSELAGELFAVMGDPIQLQQVLMNLMMNGIATMKGLEGSRELTVATKQEDDNHVLVTVSDTGTGLPPEKGRIFDAFFTTKSHGTGMGLAISRKIVGMPR